MTPDHERGGYVETNPRSWYEASPIFDRVLAEFIQRAYDEES